MKVQKAFLLAIVAGIISGAVSVAINFTVVQIRQSKIVDFYADEFVAQGIIDEDEFNQKLQVLQIQNVAIPIVIGIVGGVLIAGAYHRIGAGAFKVALAVASVVWFSLYVMPMIKYPANTDVTFNPESDVSSYTILYVGYTAASGFAALGSAIVFSRTGKKNWQIGAAGLYIGVIGVMYFVFPGASTLEFVPQQLVAEWRSSMAASMTALWLTLGILAGALLEREEKRQVADLS
jgi:hypothetical protein